MKIKFLKKNTKFIGRKSTCKKLLKQYFIKSLEKKYKDKKIKKRKINIKKNILINFLIRIYFGISYSKLFFLLKNNHCLFNKNIIILLLLKIII